MLGGAVWDGAALALAGAGLRAAEPAAAQVPRASRASPKARAAVRADAVDAAPDPSDGGLVARLAASGGFAGRAVSVPNVVDPTPYDGQPGGANYEGSVAWYRTSFSAPAPAYTR